MLTGKIILAIYLSEDKKAIKFETSDGEIIAKTDGDCCSNTWIENIENPEAAIGFVINAENIIIDKIRDDEGLIQFYGFKIETEKGTCVIDYRNESNGYYGGGLCWPGDSFYGGVYGQNISNEKWQKL